MDHINQTVAQLKSLESLEEQGFIIGAPLIQSCGNGDAIDEDFFADMYGQIVMTLASARMRRGLWLTSGWPMKMSGILGGEGVARATLAKFRHDCDMYKLLLEHGGNGAKIKAILKRHCLQWTANEQLRLASLEPAGEVMVGLKALVSSRSLGVISSQIVEDMVGAAKNDPSSKHCRKYRRPETAMGGIISRSIIEGKHRYKGLDADTHEPEATARLSADCFYRTSKPSLKFSEVQSTSQSCPWYSPCATNVNTPFADLKIISDANEKGSLNLLSSGSAGAVLCVTPTRRQMTLPLRPGARALWSGPWPGG